MEETSKTKTILRWIAVPFASIIAYILGCLLLGLWIWFNSPSDLENNISITFLFRDAAAAAMFVFAGTFTAPSHRKTVSIILATTSVCFSAFLAFLSIITPINSSLEFWLSIIASIIGAISASAFIHSQDNN